MKTSARFLAMLLAVVMIASAALSVSAFSDVTGAVEHATAINVLAQLGVIGGYEDGTFKPEQNVTRAEMAKLVYVLYTTFTDAGAGAVKFDDVKADNWAAGYISWCASKNIIGGYGDGKFGPNDNVTYDQALKMVAGTLGYNEWDSNQWPTDVRMKALNDLKLGTDIPATVKGTDKLTRAQVAQIMYNALDADMNETKNESVELIKDSGIMVNVPVAKKLAVDVWKFEKAYYTVTATENMGADKTGKTDEIVMSGVIYKADGKTVKTTIKAETFELKDLGLEAHEGKTDDLYKLQLVGLVKVIDNDIERLGNPSILGTVKDGISISFPDNRKTITIDEKKYDADDFAADAEHSFDIVVNGTKVETVFDSDNKLTDAVAKNVLPNKQYLARAIDFEGDGYVDEIVIVAKVAYKVTGFRTSSKEGKFAKLETLEAVPSTKEINVNDLSIEVAKDDIIVAATLGETTYATKVDAVKTYATKLNKGDAKVTLNEVGEVKFDKLTIAGVTPVSISTADLGSESSDVYYIYAGEIIKKETARTASEYSFAILRDVKADDEQYNDTTKEFTTAYVANLLVVEEGKLVLKKLPLDPTVGENLIKDFEVDTVEVINEVTGTKKTLAKYNYALVTSYTENKDGYYDLDFDAVDESEDYVLVAADSIITYNEDTGLYTVGDKGKVRFNDNTVIFYTEVVEEGTTKGFTDLKFYTKESITKKSFENVKTTGVSILHKDEKDRLTLLGTLVEGAIEGSASDAVISYKNDGSLILFAPESSSIEIKDGKKYNSYIFMDNATLTVKDPELDTNEEYDAATNKGTVAGRLYGYNAKYGTYDEVYASLNLESIKAETLLDVLVEDELIEYTASNQLIKVGADVTIWGLAKAGKNDVYAQFTLAELREMFELVKSYNEEKDASEVIDILMLYKVETVNGETKKTLKSIIVEVYEADKDDDTIVESVNTTIFDSFNK